MFRKIIICLLVLAMAGSVFGKLTPEQAWKKSLGGNFGLPFAGTSTYRDAVPSGVWTIREGDLWWDSDNDILYAYDGSDWVAMNSQGGAEYLYLTPSAVPDPCNVEGTLYYDSGVDNLIYRNASTWVTLATSTSGTLDEAYNQGTGITVDNGTITFTAPDADDNDVLALVQVDSSTRSVLTLTSAGTGALLEFDSNSSGGDIKGSDGDWTISKDGAAVFVGITTTGNVNFDSVDVHFDSSSADEDILWDENIFTFSLADTVILGFGDTSTAPDFTMTWDASNLVIEQKNQDAGVVTVGATDSFDWEFHDNAATGTAIFDSGASTLIFTTYDIQLKDGDFIAFGDDDDFTITSDATDVLKITPIGIDEAPIIHVGANTTGIDVRFYGNTGSEYLEWDAGNEALELVGTDIHLDDASIMYYGDGKDFMVYSDTANTLEFDPCDPGNTIKFGTAYDDAVNIIWYTDVNGNHVTFDEENQMVEFEDVILALGDDTPIILGDTIGAGVFSISSVSEVLTYLQVGSDTGEITYGLSGTDIPIKWFAEQTDDWIYFNADELEFEDVVLQLMDDTEMHLGDGDDVVLRYDHSTDNNFEIVVASSGMSIVTNDFIITTDGTAANQIALDATGTIADASGDAIVISTTDGGILLDADNANNGDIGLDAADDIRLTAAGDIIITIGDHMSIVDDDVVSFGTDDDVTFSYVTGDGNLQVIGPVDFETTYVEFNGNPVGIQDDGTAWSGTDTERNFFVIDGVNFEQYIIGTVGSPIPFMTDEGLNIAYDEETGEGAEIGQGITAMSKSAFTSNADSFYIKVKFKLETVTSLGLMFVGFREASAYNVVMTSYDTYVGLNVNNGTINVLEEKNGSAAAEDDTGDSAWGNGETKTLEVRIDGAGDTTWWIDGSPITNQASLSFDWSDNETVIPVIHTLFDATAGCEIELISYECGIFTQ